MALLVTETDLSLRPFSGSAPFVLFEDARPGARPARLFSSPGETITAYSESEIEPALAQLRQGLARGLHAAGWMSYEAGRAFEQRLMQRTARHQDHRFPLLWFGLFENAETISAQVLRNALPDPDGAWISSPRPRMTRAQYGNAFDRAKDYIVAGDVYQINLSYRADLTVLGDPLAAYARLRGAGQGGCSGVVFDGENWLLSTSPELFFRVSADGKIEARPMKGTAKRHPNPEQDRAAAEQLKADPKELAENVMIVDLLRNDISRLATRGSVHVPELFTVETYPTLHTLTSTVRAEIKQEHDIADILRALFPCGSITGAPKIRAMEIIDELERDSRGPYTGSIGWIAPDGTAEFNVAIRTLAVSQRGAEIGLGSAVVFDSTAQAEWDECRTKGAFLTAGSQTFELIETMRFEPDIGIERLRLHLARLANSSQTFGFQFDASLIRQRLEAAIETVSKACVVRMILAPNGALSIELRDILTYPCGGPAVCLAPLPVDARDFRLRHKTTLRAFHDEARIASGADEVVFIGVDGFVTEGSISNVFVERRGVLITPPAARGLLPGVLRAELIEQGKAREGEVRPSDLEGGFFLGNSVRGLVPARLVSVPTTDPVKPPDAGARTAQVERGVGAAG